MSKHKPISNDRSLRSILFTMFLGVLIIGLSIVLFSSITGEKDGKIQKGVTPVWEKELVNSSSENDVPPFMDKVTFDEKKINPENPMEKNLIVFYDQGCVDAKNAACDLNALNQFLYGEFQEQQENIAYVNNNHKQFQELAKKFDLTKGSPILYVKKEKAEQMIKNVEEFLKKPQIAQDENAKKAWEETLATIKENFQEKNLENGFFPLSLHDWIIWEKNACEEGDWKKFASCATAYLITDSACPADDYEACSPSMEENLKNIASTRMFVKKLDKNSPEAKAYLTHNTSKTYPFLVIKMQEKAMRQQFIELMIARNEAISIDKETWYALPEFLKTDWKDDSKACLPDIELNKQTDKSRYLSCSNPSCKDKKACLPEEKNTLTMYTMGYCPYCKPVAKRLAELKKELNISKINLIHLLQATTQTPTQLSDLKALHGEGEVLEAARQYCINKLKGETFFLDYLAKRYENPEITDESNLKDTYKHLNLNDTDVKSIDACMTETSTIAELANQANKSYELGVQGTPTFMINNKYMVMWGYEEMIKAYKEHNK